MSSPRSRIQKGKDLENYVSDQIIEKGLDPNSSRSVGSGSGTREKADIRTSLQILGRDVGIECKNQKVPHIKDWWKQTCELEKLDKEPVLVYSLGGEGFGETKAIIYLDTLLELIKKSQAPKVLDRDMNRNEKYKIEKLKQTCHEVLKIFNDRA